MPTTSKITLKGMAAENIDSDQYVDGSIDEAHIANDAVNFATHLKAGTDGELITWDSSGNAAAVPVGTDTHVLTSGGTGVAPTFQAASGGDVRNFIIDGAFTQWPEGNITGIVHSAYTSALMKAKKGAMDELVWDAKKTTDSPTVAESGYDSIYCYHADITTAESTLATDEYSSFVYYISGLDFAALDRQEMTLNFWHKHTVTGTCVVAFGNAAGNRYYLGTYTQSVSNTWEEASITFTGETTGTWVTDAHATDFGMGIYFVLASGSTLHQTANTWWTWPGSGASFAQGVSGMANHVSSASNDFKIAQVGLYLGSSAPARFLAEPIATVINQVDYYIQRYTALAATDGLPVLLRGHNGTVSFGPFMFRRNMRVPPTQTFSAVGDIQVNRDTTLTDCTVIGYNPGATTFLARLQCSVGSSVLAANGCYNLCFKALGDWMQFDARY